MATHAPGFLSRRAAASQKPALPYWEAFVKAQGDLWTPDNPNGYIACTVAENRLSCDLVQQGLAKYASKFPEEMLYYQDMRGIQEFRDALASFLTTTFMKGLAIDPNHISVLSGVGSVIDLLYHCIAEPGQGVLIPAPYYPAFDNDLQIRNQVAAIPVHLDTQQQDHSATLDAAAAVAAAEGHPIAALMFTHPDNPTGRLYSREELRSMISWCLRNKVHCVSDEIYANSVFSESATFYSTAHVVQHDIQGFEGSEYADDLVHVLFGFSKDFCGSGLRLGCLYSRNEALNGALNNVSYFSSTPAPLQWAFSKLLQDEGWLNNFLTENKRRMREAFSGLTRACDDAGLSYQPAEAAMFLWIDLRAALIVQNAGGASANGHSSSYDHITWDDEDRFWKYLVDKHKVVLSPGSSCHAAKPGFFRVCWAWPHPHSLPVLAQRLATAVREYQQPEGRRASSGDKAAATAAEADASIRA